jgi:hypothetical protein
MYGYFRAVGFACNYMNMEYDVLILYKSDNKMACRTMSIGQLISRVFFSFHRFFQSAG